MIARTALLTLLTLAAACTADPSPPPPPAEATPRPGARPGADPSTWQRAPTPAASSLRGTNLAPSSTQGSGVSGRRLVR